MKKLVVLALCVLFASVSIAIATPLKTKETNVLNTSGTFVGYIGIPGQQDPIIMGNISGTYQLRNSGGAFNGIWDINYKNYSGAGTVQGRFGKHILIGRLSVQDKTLPIIGFIGFNATSQKFLGRAMSFVGPALYFWGTYT